MCVMNWGLGEGTRMIASVSMCHHASVQELCTLQLHLYAPNQLVSLLLILNLFFYDIWLPEGPERS